MGKQLIIAEKNSMLKDIVDVIGGMERKVIKNNLAYYEGSKYVGVPLSGHIFELYDIKDYEGEEKVDWEDIDLPYFPREWKLKAKGKTKRGFPSGKEKFDLIKDIIKRNDITEIINAGDPDAEGELLVNEVIYEAFKDLKIVKPIKRIWIEDHTEKTILRELKYARDIKNTEGYYNQGLARSHSDWINGINSTILISLRGNETYNSGRLIVPLVKQVYDRDMEIKNFKPEKYYELECKITKEKKEVKLNFSNLKFKKEQLQEAKSVLENLKLSEVIVEKIEEKEQKRKPKKLFSMATLQKYMFNKYKIKIDETLKIVQSLYEQKFLTYPRTNSEYMTENEKEKAKDIISSLNKKGYKDIKMKETKDIFDSSKVDSHSAITPTECIADIEKLKDKEKLVYETVLNRFLANFCEEECILNNTIITFKLGNKNFENITTNLKGTAIKKEGYLKYENDLTEKDIPEFKEGEIYPGKFDLVEKETVAPKKMTQASLVDFCLKPFKAKESETEETEEVDDTKEYKDMLKGIVLGTEATRADTIKKIITVGYIEDKNNTLSITEKGKQFIEILQKLNINLWKEASVELSVMLTKVKNREMSVEEVEKYDKEKVKNMVEVSKNVKLDIKPTIKQNKESIGNCPLCGKEIFENQKSFSCSGYKEGCKFSIWKSIVGKTITKAIAKELLTKGESKKIDGFKSKAGKSFSAKLVIKKDGNIGFEF